MSITRDDYLAWERETFKTLAAIDLDLAYNFLVVPYEGLNRARAQYAVVAALRTAAKTGDARAAHLELELHLPELAP